MLKQTIGISSQIVTSKSILITGQGDAVSPRLMFGLNKKKSSQFQSLVYSISAKNIYKRSISRQKTGLIFNRMGSKNMKRWL